MSLTLKSAVEAEFRKLVEGECATLAGTIMAGMLEHDRYKSLTGEVRGLRRAMELLETANSNIEKRK